MCLITVALHCSRGWVSRSGDGEPFVGDAPSVRPVARGRRGRDRDQRRSGSGGISTAIEDGLEIQNRASVFCLFGYGWKGKSYLL